MSMDNPRICTNSSDLVVPINPELEDICRSSQSMTTPIVTDSPNASNANGKICEIVEIKPIEEADMCQVQTPYRDAESDENPECKPTCSVTTEVNSIECENYKMIIPESTVTEDVLQVGVSMKGESEVTIDDTQGYSCVNDSATDLERQSSVDHRLDAVIKGNSVEVKLEDHVTDIQKNATRKVQQVLETIANEHEVTTDWNVVEIKVEGTTAEFGNMEQMHLSHFDAVNAKVDWNPQKCYLCGRNFRKQSTFTAHIKRHIQAEKASKKIPEKCKQCGRTFSKRWALSEHMKHHKSTRNIIERNPVKCNLCGVTFINQRKLTMHMERHSQPKYICDECGEQFPTKNQMLDHKKTSHPKMGEKDQFACGICEMKCQKQSKLDEHREEHEFVDRHINEGIKKTHCTLFRVPKTNKSCSKNLYSCHFCPFITASQTRMRLHMADRHRKRMAKYKTKVDSISQINCGQGGLKNLSTVVCETEMDEMSTNAGSTKMNLESDTGVTDMQVSEGISGKLEDIVAEDETWEVMQVEETVVDGRSIDKSLNDSGAVQGTNNKPEMHPNVSPDAEDAVGPFECTVCRKSYLNQRSLTIHMDVHRRRNYQLFTCDECGEVFIRSKLLLDHKKKVHWMRALYKCEICGKRCYLRGDFYNHLRTHEHEKKLGNVDDYIKQYPIPSPDVSNYQCPEIVQEKEMAADVDDSIQDYSPTDSPKPQASIDASVVGSVEVKLEDPNSELWKLKDATVNWSYIEKKTLQSKIIKGDIEQLEHPGSFASTRDVTYPCGVCGRLFSAPSILAEHMSRHKTDIAGACDVCGKSFKLEKSLIKHMRQHTNEISNTCAVSSEDIESDIPEHPDAFARTKTFMCTVCGSFHGNQSALTRHLKQHRRNGNQMFPCHCGKIFMRRTLLLQHEKQVHTVYKCGLCGEEFPCYNDLFSHRKIHQSKSRQIKIKHKDRQSKAKSHGSGGKIHPCGLCGRTFSAQHYLISHMHLHASGTCEACDICGKVFKTGNCMSTHRRNHASKMSGLITCDICGERFTTLNKREAHRLLHSRQEQQKIMHTIKLENPNLKSSVAPWETQSVATNMIKCEPIENVSAEGGQVHENSGAVFPKIKISEATTNMKDIPADAGSTDMNVKLETPDATDGQVPEASVSDFMRTDVGSSEAIAPNDAGDAVSSQVNEKPFKCTFCGNTFGAQCALTKHLKDHRLGCYLTYTCEECGMTFPKKISLVQHKKRSHSKKVQLICDICGSKFYSLTNLGAHREMHWCKQEIFKTVQDVLQGEVCVKSEKTP